MIIRARIIAAFTELSKFKGFYRVTMDELAAQTGLSKRTLYRYFRSKDQIVQAVLDNFIVTMNSEIDQLISSRRTPEEVFTYMLTNIPRIGQVIINPLVMSDLRQHYPHCWKKIDDYRLKRVQEIAIMLLDDSNKEFTQEIDHRIVAEVIMASVQAVLNPDFILSNGLTFEDTVRQLIEFFKHGFLKA